MLFANQKTLWTKRTLLALMSVLLISACSDDLSPSSTDKRIAADQGVDGHLVGQFSEHFSVIDTRNNTVDLDELLETPGQVILYFTMWCSTCDTHMTSLRSNIVQEFPNTKVIFIDYVSANNNQAFNAQIAYGYASATVIADNTHRLLTQYDGGMGTTVIINNDRTILMNESYKESKIRQLLSLSN